MRSTRVLLVVSTLLAIALSSCASPPRQDSDAMQISGEGPVVFVCEHGAAKSVLAAALFNQRAAQLNVPLRAVARGIDPDEQVPDRLLAALRSEGLDADEFRPTRLTGEDIATSIRVIGLGVDGQALGSEHPVELWSDLPSPTDYAAIRAALLERIDQLLSTAVSPENQLEN